MNLKPQDVVVLLKLLVSYQAATYAHLANQLAMSPSEVHAAVKRAAGAGLIDEHSREVRKRSLLEFLIHGVKYAFPVSQGPVSRSLFLEGLYFLSFSMTPLLSSHARPRMLM